MIMTIRTTMSPKKVEFISVQTIHGSVDSRKIHMLLTNLYFLLGLKGMSLYFLFTDTCYLLFSTILVFL